jgi:O-methyltransferase involved in polyketide biosynthesis
MDLKRITNDTAKTVVSYLTYQAVRTVVAQLRETNPPLSMWFQSFSARTSIQDGEVYLQALMQENPDLALRVMTVRVHLAEEVADYMPEMIRSGVQQGNMTHRRDYLERVTSLELSGETPSSELLGSENRRRSEEFSENRGNRHPTLESDQDSAES